MEDHNNARRFLIKLLLIGAGALALRLISLAELRNTPLFEVLLGDSREYDAWAQQIAAGHWIGTGSFYQAPVYPYLMGVVFDVAGHHVMVVRVLQSVFGATACVMLGLAGRRFFNERVGLVASSLLAVYPPSIFFDGLIQKSSLDGLLVTSTLAALGAFVARPSMRWPVALGLAVGLLMLNRENARVLYPILLAWLAIGFRNRPLRTRMGWAGIVTAAAALVLAPVVIRNYYAGGEFILSTSQLGPNFYIGNHADAPGYYEGLVADRGSVEFEREDATRLAETARGGKLSPGEVSDYWAAQALDYIQGHPLNWMCLMARKLDLTFKAREAVDTESIEVHAEYSHVLRFLSLFNFGVVLGLAAVGVWMTRRDWRRLTVLYALLGGLAASVVIFYVMSRYRYPMVPILLLFAAVGLTAIVDFRRDSGRRWILGITLGLIVAVYSNLPARLPGDNTKVDLGSELVRMGRSAEAAPLLRQAIAELPDYAPAHFSLALALDGVGENEEALAEYEATVKLWPEDFKAQEALALALQEAGRTKEALDRFREAARLEPDSAPAQNNLAMALHQAGKAAEAISHYEAAIALTHNYAEGHSKLALALAATGRNDEAVTHFTEALRIQPDNADIRLSFGSLLMDLHRAADALAQYEQAVSLMPQSLDAQSHLAEAYMLEGRFSDAIGRLNAAITIARDSGQADAIRSLLASINRCEARLGRKGSVNSAAVR
ncbi:MAG TPA: tetratricopeptide repeat protein [Blastocatellia bacterium]|nr:tetratricopeptide repeat protein [Blastocatellia bacterium]